jgi:hypothetical protein
MPQSKDPMKRDIYKIFWALIGVLIVAVAYWLAGPPPPGW